MKAAVAKAPFGNGWSFVRRYVVNGVTCHQWTSGPILATSSIIFAEMPDGDGIGLQWLVSISAGPGKRPKPHHVRRALRAFGMVGAELDSHHPGNAEHYFLCVDPARRVACQCKVDEVTHVEPDGYRWTNPRPETGEACRGCEAAPITGRRCPLHPSAPPEMTYRFPTGGGPGERIR